MRNVFNTHLGSFLCLCRPLHGSQSVKLGQARRRCVQIFASSQVRTATRGPAEHFHPCTCHLPTVAGLQGLGDTGTVPWKAPSVQGESVCRCPPPSAPPSCVVILAPRHQGPICPLSFVLVGPPPARVQLEGTYSLQGAHRPTWNRALGSVPQKTLSE